VYFLQYAFSSSSEKAPIEIRVFLVTHSPQWSSSDTSRFGLRR
jgi:hypothetical protein